MKTPSIRLNALAVIAALAAPVPAHAFGWSDVMGAVNRAWSGFSGTKPTIGYGGTPSAPTVVATTSTAIQAQQAADYLRTTRGLRTNRIDIGRYLATGQIWPSPPNKANTTDKMPVAQNNCHGSGCNGEATNGIQR